VYKSSGYSTSSPPFDVVSLEFSHSGGCTVGELARNDLLAKMTFEQILEEGEGASHSCIWRKRIPGSYNCNHQGHERSIRRQVWLQHSEGQVR